MTPVWDLWFKDLSSERSEGSQFGMCDGTTQGSSLRMTKSESSPRALSHCRARRARRSRATALGKSSRDGSKSKEMLAG